MKNEINNETNEIDNIKDLQQQLLDIDSELYGEIKPTKTGVSKLWQDFQTAYRTSNWANSGVAEFLGTFTPYGLIHWSLGTKEDNPDLLMAALSVTPAAGIKGLAKLAKLAKFGKAGKGLMKVANGVDAVTNFNPFEYVFKKGKNFVQPKIPKQSITADDIKAYKARVYNIADEKTKMLKERAMLEDKITELKTLANNPKTAAWVKPYMTNGQLDIRKVNNNILPDYLTGIPDNIKQQIGIPRSEATRAYNEAVSKYLLREPSRFQTFLRNPEAKWLLGATVLGTPAAVISATELAKPGTFTDFSNTVDVNNQEDNTDTDNIIPTFYYKNY